MVDVSDKPVTSRLGRSQRGGVQMSARTLRLQIPRHQERRPNRHRRISRDYGLQRKTADIIPLMSPLPLDEMFQSEYSARGDDWEFEVTASAETTGQPARRNGGLTACQRSVSDAVRYA
ncbi:UNVERIFIED_CONTAM: hypothetical protein GTU68_038039 [Idotea baltica]|nr:hypothetical protein [Idotea baltica]